MFLMQIKLSSNVHLICLNEIFSVLQGAKPSVRLIFLYRINVHIFKVVNRS